MKANAILAAFVALVACGGGGDDSAIAFPENAYVRVDSAQKSYSIEVRTSPQPPVAGVNTIELRIRDAQSRPADGLSLTVVPFMPAHSHGASVHPTIVPKGDGAYVVQNVSTFMAGRWELDTQIQGSPNDTAAILLDVR